MAVLWTKHSRILFCEPPPHVTEHSDQSVQGVKDGQVFSLHFSIISESPSEHLKASDLGKTHSLAFFRSPPPQLLVQGVQSVHSVQTGHGLLLQVSVSIIRKKNNYINSLGWTWAGANIRNKDYIYMLEEMALFKVNLFYFLEALLFSPFKSTLQGFP